MEASGKPAQAPAVGGVRKIPWPRHRGLVPLQERQLPLHPGMVRASLYNPSKCPTLTLGRSQQHHHYEGLHRLPALVRSHPRKGGAGSRSGGVPGARGKPMDVLDKGNNAHFAAGRGALCVESGTSHCTVEASH